ncbi:hypothetical protein OGAPHI_006951 [Ogataea philodendri]|uniref:Uncharacterized protein n=1 Tax=Ogataea philodendri TaxID=1378263 RepID=A0A9P8SZY8_9ASCO|nr:uncharacterized protein OGAPHI_006951 [Ogataea philodendri]KAH3660365.1 hypothetical protein OGAPHI_006951 [Ogataea philodendri]
MCTQRRLKSHMDATLETLIKSRLHYSLNSFGCQNIDKCAIHVEIQTIESKNFPNQQFDVIAANKRQIMTKEFGPIFRIR